MTSQTALIVVIAGGIAFITLGIYAVVIQAKWMKSSRAEQDGGSEQ